MPSKTGHSRQQAWVALLRGINVGGKHLLPMKTLLEIVQKAECDNVATYIQSGNVVFTSACAEAGLAEAISRGIEQRCGFRPPVILRTAAQVRKIIEANPFSKSNEAGKALHVVFLADKPANDGAKALRSLCAGGEQCVLRGRELYLLLPHGAGRTKLTNAAFDSKLKAISTVRNWRTVLKLREMAEAISG